MLINLDISLSRKLREKIISSGNYSYTKRGKFKIPGKKSANKMELDAYNCICAIMDRIDMLVEHCNSLNVENNSITGEFALFDMLNYGQTLIDCIDMLGNIYSDLWKKEITNDIFDQADKDGKGNDEKYFKYLRSLCSIHPVETTGYAMYQGKEAEWCPYITSGKDGLHRAINCGRVADFYAIVYRNDQCGFKEIPIYIVQIFEYIQKRYMDIEKIICLIDGYKQEQIVELKGRHIKTPNEFADYKSYLMNLANEISIRYNKGSEYRVKEWEAILETHFDDSDKENILECYKNELYKNIEHVHEQLQKMECDIDDMLDINAFTGVIWNDVGNYSYEMNEIYTLYPGEFETDSDWNFSFIDMQPELCDQTLKSIFELLEYAKNKKYTHEDMCLFYEAIEQKYILNYSERSRMYLKVMEDVFNGAWQFDYYLNDWHVWVQIQLAQWILQKDSNKS